jgi:Skp family chaperone for outer membrane proteins
MVDRTHTMTRNPAWWSEKHALAWSHVKDALERDWEQTKADFSGSGQKLNQTVGDSTDPAVVAKAAEKTRENMEEESEKADKIISKAREDIAKEHLRLSETVGAVRKDLAAEEAKAKDKLAHAHAAAKEKVAEAKDRAAGSIAKACAKIEETLLEWHDAQQELRYGYSVRSQYPANHAWNPKLEEKLQAEWDELDTGRSWKLARMGIRRGWEYVGKP